MFDSMIQPILLYGSEVWGFENVKIIEQIHLKFCKRILKVRNTTPSFMVYGELGRNPLEISVKLRMVSFWNKLVVNENKLSSLLYRLMIRLKNSQNVNFKWINFVESIFNETGMSYIFSNQIAFYDKALLKQVLLDQFIQKWYSELYSTSRGQFYSIFKKDFELENYLRRLPESLRIWITKFRLSNIRLPIEIGRWYNIPKEQRMCNFCRESIGDEYHILFICQNENIVQLRNKYIPVYYRNNPNASKMKGMLSMCNTVLYKKLSIFIKKIASLL